VPASRQKQARGRRPMRHLGFVRSVSVAPVGSDARLATEAVTLTQRSPPNPVRLMVPPLVGSSSKRMAFSRPRAACHSTPCQATWAGGSSSALSRARDPHGSVLNPLSIEVSVPTTVHWRGRRSTRLRRSRSVVGHLDTRVPALVRVRAESYRRLRRNSGKESRPTHVVEGVAVEARLGRALFLLETD
jgi:hypothetical protein